MVIFCLTSAFPATPRLIRKKTPQNLVIFPISGKLGFFLTGKELRMEVEGGGLGGEGEDGGVDGFFGGDGGGDDDGGFVENSGNEIGNSETENEVQSEKLFYDIVKKPKWGNIKRVIRS